MTGTVETRLKSLGIEILQAPVPVANYVPFTVSGNLVFVSGQGTLVDGELQYIGKLGRDFTVEDGYRAARLCAVNVLAQLRAACDGDLDRVTRVLRVGGFVNSMPDFTAQPKVVNGSSRRSEKSAAMPEPPSAFLRCPTISRSKWTLFSKFADRPGETASMRSETS